VSGRQFGIFYTGEIDLVEQVAPGPLKVRSKAMDYMESRELESNAAKASSQSAKQELVFHRRRQQPV